MRQLLEQCLQALSGLPIPVQLAAPVVPFLLLFGVGYVVVYAPRLGEITQLRNEMAKMQRTLAQQQQPLRNIALPTDAERASWMESAQLLNVKIPPDPQVPQLIEELAVLARQSRIADITFASVDEQTVRGRSARQTKAPLTAVVGGKSTETLLIRVAFHARYEDFATFLGGLNALGRLATLEDMRMRRTVPEMSVQMTLRTYFFKAKG